MKRHHTLALLLLASVAAGLWLFRPSELAVEPTEETAESCEQGSACSTVPSPGHAPTQEDPVPASGPAPAPAPAPGAAGEGLREKADRLIAEGKVREGLDAMRKAVEADPSARNHGDLGALLDRLTVFDEAVRNLKRAAELDHDNADRWIALANAYYRKVEPGEAWKAERRAREAEPGLVLGRDSNGMRIRRSDSAAAKK